MAIASGDLSQYVSPDLVYEPGDLVADADGTIYLFGQPVGTVGVIPSTTTTTTPSTTTTTDPTTTTSTTTATPTVNPQLAVISNILNGQGTATDWATIGGRITPEMLQTFIASNQPQNLTGLATNFLSSGAPTQGRFNAAQWPGFNQAWMPAYMDTSDLYSQGNLRKLSAQGGNPFGNPQGLWRANQATVAGTTLADINNSFGSGWTTDQLSAPFEKQKTLFDANFNLP